MKKQSTEASPALFPTESKEIATTDVQLQQGVLAIEKQTAIRQAFAPFFAQCDEWKEKAHSLVITDVSQIELMSQAREARLALKRIRSSVESERKTLKELPLAECKFIDETANSFKNEIEPIEDYLEKQENYVKEQEEIRKRKIVEQRSIELEKYGTNPRFYDLLNISDEEFVTVLESSKLAYDARIENEKKIEQERLAQIEDEKQKQIEVRKENERMKAEKELMDKRNAELRPYIIFIREYDKMTALDEIEYQKELAEIKEAAKQHSEAEAQKKAELEAQQEKQRKENEALQANAKKEREIAEAKLKKEREENARLQAEIQSKKDAEILAEKKRKADEKKALLAPDKQKLIALANELQNYAMPVLKTQEGEYIIVNVKGLLNKTVAYIRENAEKL